MKFYNVREHYSNSLKANNLWTSPSNLIIEQYVCDQSVSFRCMNQHFMRWSAFYISHILIKYNYNASFSKRLMVIYPLYNSQQIWMTFREVTWLPYPHRENHSVLLLDTSHWWLLQIAIVTALSVLIVRLTSDRPIQLYNIPYTWQLFSTSRTYLTFTSEHSPEQPRLNIYF